MASERQPRLDNFTQRQSEIVKLGGLPRLPTLIVLQKGSRFTFQFRAREGSNWIIGWKAWQPEFRQLNAITSAYVLVSPNDK